MGIQSAENKLRIVQSRERKRREKEIEFIICRELFCRHEIRLLEIVTGREMQLTVKSESVKLIKTFNYLAKLGIITLDLCTEYL